MSGYPTTQHWPQYHPAAAQDSYLSPTNHNSYIGNHVDYQRSQQYPDGYFEDPMSDEMSVSDQESLLDSAAPCETPSIELERGNFLLNFSRQSTLAHILDYNYQPVTISLSSQLSGKFSYSPSASTRMSELAKPIICYRRNLFTVAGSITLPRNLRYVSMRQGEHLPVSSTELHISATETLDNHPVRLMSVPVKAVAHESKVEPEPVAIPLTPTNRTTYDQDFFTVPVDWKRLQFRTSTANNGRRKELQQHYLLTIRVIATLENGHRLSIYQACSAPIVVRGRSPRNFSQPKSTSGSVKSRRSRSGTVEPPLPSLRLSKTRSEPQRDTSGSFEHPAMPSPSYNVWGHNTQDLRSYPTDSVVAHSTSEAEAYHSQRTTPYQGGMFQQDNQDYFGQSPPKRSRGSAHHTPRMSPLAVNAVSNYAYDTSYQFLPPMPDSTTWFEQFNTTYEPQVIASSLAIPPQPKTKSSRTKQSTKRGHHHKSSNGRC